MAIRQQVVRDCIRPILLRAHSILNAHRTFVLEERQSSQTFAQRLKNPEVYRRRIMERKDALHSCLGVATGPKQLHAQEIH
mgnify:CR=1 FL=1